MSDWTYIHGTIVVSPIGRTQEEKKYVLDTVLKHLPNIPSSEEGMNTYVIKKNGYDISFSENNRVYTYTVRIHFSRRWSVKGYHIT